jgi:hypothetical protein
MEEREKLRKTLDEEAKERRRRKNLIRVLSLPEGALFISTYYRALSAETRPVNNGN